MTSVSNSHTTTTSSTSSHTPSQSAAASAKKSTASKTPTTKKPTTKPAVELKPVDATQLKSSVAAVIGTLEDKTVKPDQLDNIKLSEEVLYASNVRAHLKNESPAALKTFDDELKVRYDRRVGRNDTQAIGKAINDILDNAVTNKQITAAQYQEIMAQSLGKSQIDGNKAAISSKVVSGGIEKAVLMLEKNKPATATQVTAFEKSVSTLQFQAPATTRAHIAQMQQIFKSVGTKTALTPKPGGTTNSGSGSTPAVSGENSTDGASTPTTTPDPTLTSGPNAFDYLDKSRNDQKMLIKLPVNFGQDITSLQIQDSMGNVLAEQTARSVGDKDGRLYFRFDKTGESYGSSFSAVMTYTDGSTRTIDIKDSKMNASTEYAAY